MSRLIVSGPLPLPEILEGYERIDPGAARKIIDDMLEESKHRRSMEKQVFDRADKRFFIGQCFGFVIAVLGILGGVAVAYIAISNANIVGIIAGSALSGVSLTGLVAQFTGQSRKKDKHEKEENK